jgi:hypothetical protein
MALHVFHMPGIKGHPDWELVPALVPVSVYGLLESGGLGQLPNGEWVVDE